MYQLKVVHQNGKLFADSRDVSIMIDKPHNDLMKSIRNYAEHLTKGNFPLSEFFIESTYHDGSGRTLPCFLLTRKGCDMVANKMTGEKGTLFTATYVTKFEEMERQLTSGYNLPQNYKEALVALVGQVEVNEKLEEKNLMLEQRVVEFETKVSYYERILTSKGTMTITQIAKDYDLSGPALNKMLHEEHVQYKQNRQWLLYTKHMNKGYTKSETINIQRSNGDPDVTLNTRWTQKGRLFIHELLAKRGIIPYMDRQDIGA